MTEHEQGFSHQQEEYAHKQRALFHELDGALKDKDHAVQTLKQELENHKEQAFVELEQTCQDIERMANMQQSMQIFFLPSNMHLRLRRRLCKQWWLRHMMQSLVQLIRQDFPLLRTKTPPSLVLLMGQCNAPSRVIHRISLVSNSGCCDVLYTCSARGKRPFHHSSGSSCTRLRSVKVQTSA